jgi:hypothetical protein
MSETPKEKLMEEKDAVGKESGEDEVWEKDQKRRKYYYDDAHGYETYVDDEAEDD